MTYEKQIALYKKIIENIIEKFNEIEKQNSQHLNRGLPKDANANEFLRLDDIVWVMIYNAQKIKVTCIPCIFNNDLTKVKNLISGEIYTANKTNEEIEAMLQTYADQFYKKIKNELPFIHSKIGNLIHIINQYKKENKEKNKNSALIKANINVRTDLARDIIVSQYEKTYGKSKTSYIVQYNEKNSDFDNLSYIFENCKIYDNAYYSPYTKTLYMNIYELANLSKSLEDYATLSYKYHIANRQLNKLKEKQREEIEEQAKVIDKQTQEMLKF